MSNGGAMKTCQTLVKRLPNDLPHTPPYPLEGVWQIVCTQNRRGRPPFTLTSEERRR
jgi:hypothetical protein